MDTNDKKAVANFHNSKNVEDKIYLIGELEHTMRHAMRGSSVELLNAQNSKDANEEQFHKTNAYVLSVWAEQAKNLRRQVMMDTFAGFVSETTWCLSKSVISIKQIANELGMNLTPEMRRALDALADDVLSNVLQRDMTGCTSCQEDIAKTEEKTDKIEVDTSNTSERKNK